MSAPARYIMVGGFLGAGKTTAVGQLARHLTEEGLRVGLITNDQSTGLVDSSILRKRGFEVEEIGGGCFCCRFDSLNDAVNELTERTRPDVFVAEPVGSCTDLLATVSYPLRRIYGDRYHVAPLSVLVDPVRAARVLGLRDGKSFSAKVIYVYEKQLEEADLILVNKCDLIGEEERAELEAALAARFPQAEILSCSARDGVGLAGWYERLLSGEGAVLPTPAVDYQLYAEGEALLGWLNCTVTLSGGEPFDANALLVELTHAVRRRLAGDGLEIAHLKMTLDADQEGQLSVVSLVESDGEPDLRESLLDRVRGGSLIVNLRAEADPEVLRSVTEEALGASLDGLEGLSWTLDHVEHFRPAPPVPVHRMTVTGDAGGSLEGTP